MHAAPEIVLTLIGIGTGNPQHLTVQAINALNRCELILIPRKGADKADLADMRRTICALHVDKPARLAEFDLPVRDSSAQCYLAGVHDWHTAIAAAWTREITAHLPAGGRAALLVWGDPCLYDSSLRIAQLLQTAGMALRVEVIPGLSSIQLLTAAHAIALNTLAEPILITTGRQLRDTGWPAGLQTVVVMLDGACAFETLAPAQLHIYWAAYLGMPNQLLLAGPLAATGPQILKVRAKARQQHGWIMDIYLIRRV